MTNAKLSFDNEMKIKKFLNFQQLGVLKLIIDILCSIFTL